MRLPKNTQVAAIQEEDENENDVVQERDRDDYIPKQDQHSIQAIAGGDSYQKQQKKLTIISDANDKKESKGPSEVTSLKALIVTTSLFTLDPHCLVLCACCRHKPKTVSSPIHLHLQFLANHP